MKANTSTSHLSKEPFPAPSGYQQPLPQKGHELLLGEFPALQLVGAFAVHPTEQVRLPGFCWEENMEGSPLVSPVSDWPRSFLWKLAWVISETADCSLQGTTKVKGFHEKSHVFEEKVLAQSSIPQHAHFQSSSDEHRNMKGLKTNNNVLTNKRSKLFRWNKPSFSSYILWSGSGRLTRTGN